ncbi:OB-fold nucleic acid binding domain-containing protein [Candidatus Aenigmatarchaeota archaeon]
MKDVVNKIVSLSGLSETEIVNKIEDKKAELSGMVSDEGAAYMVARELGISMLKEDKLKIKDIVDGMKSVSIVAKLIKLREHEYSTEKSKGFLASLILGDETGTIKLTLWNEEMNRIEGIKEGDVVHIFGYVKKNNLDELELRLGYGGHIEKSDAEIKLKHEAKRKSICDFQEGELVEVKAAFLQIFESNVFYEICPFCSTRIKKENNYYCEDHGAVTPDHGIVLSGIVDDGTGNIRAVLFGGNAEFLLGLKTKEAWTVFDNEKSLSSLYNRINLGKEYLLEGKIRKNKFFNRLEFVVNSIKEIEVVKEMNALLDV